MKVVINAVAAKMSGAVTYVTSLLHHLPPPESGFRFFVFLPGETAKLLPEVRANIQLCPLPVEYSGGWKRIWWEQVTLRRFLRREKVDLLYSSANFAMFRCPVRQVLLVRNALYFSRIYRQMVLTRHSLAFRLDFTLRRWLILLSVRSADVLMTPTQAMLDELRQGSELVAKRIVVNPYGVLPADPEGGAEKHDPNSTTASQRPVRLIYVSLYSDHKNLTTLLNALPLLNRNGGGRFLLQTTVDPGWKGAAWTATHKADLELARVPAVAPWVEFLRPLTRPQLQQLYGDADLFVFPSFCESFGHPMVEAMVHGLPVVAADTPVNREMCGEAAVYFRPLDPQDLAEKVALVGRDRALSEKLGAEGRRRAAACFRWQDHVERLLQAFHAA